MHLLERESQMRALDDALGSAKDGEGCVALVSGEAGIGKTSLVEDFVKSKAGTWRILRGACDSLFTPRPLGPLHDIAPQTGGNLLKRLESDSDRTAVFSACLAELVSQPTILVIEDVHWADEATLDLLKYLGRRVRQTPCLMILTYRDDEIGVEHPLRLLLGDFASSAPLQRIPVTALTEGAVRDLARGRNVDAAELYRLTNGNPFFVTEVLAVERGIPPTVRDAVLARAARLSPAGRRLLEAAAVIGLRSEAWLLDKVCETDATSLAECISGGMLRSDGDYYAFRHELARQTILEATFPQRRVELHQKTLAALEASAETHQDLAQLANHAEGSGNGKAILEYAPAAARQAAAAGAHRQAAALYELALRFGDGLPTAEDARMLEAYAEELRFWGPKETIIPVRRQIIEKYRGLGDRLREGLNTSILACELRELARNAESEEAIRAAIAMLEARPPSVELAWAYGAQCYLLSEGQPLVECVAAGEKAIALAERFGDMDVLSRASNLAGQALLLMGDERGRTVLERSLTVAREHGLHYAVGMVLVNWAFALTGTFQFDEAERLVQEGIAYTSAHDDDYHLSGLLSAQAQIRLYQGLWTEAADLMRRALQRPNFSLMIGGDGLRILGHIGVRRGEAGAEQSLRDALIACTQANDLELVGTMRAALAEAAWLAGHAEQAIEEARADYELVEKQHMPSFLGALAFWRWRAGEVFTPPEWIAKPYALQIAGDWRAAAKEWEQRGCPYEQGMALMDGDEAAQLTAVEIFERLGARPILEKLKQEMRQRGIRGIPRGPRPTTRENAFGLTARELDVLSHLVKGSSNTAIARGLSLSRRTVEHHIAAILQKTGTQSRVEAVALAMQAKLFVSE